MTLELVRRNALQALRPPPSIPLADWIEANVFLPATASALPGRMRLWSYQRGICEALEDPKIESICVMKSARIGFTALIGAVIAHYVANAPAPILTVQPTSDDARDFAVDTEKLFEASPTLRGLLSDASDESGRSTMMHKRFAGGSLKYLAARSPRNFRRHTAKVALADEIDGYDVTAEGDVLELLKMRTQTFRDRKLLFGSTPVVDIGPITRLYDQSDKRIFEVPCVECGEYSEITWRDIRWDEGRPETAAWCCPKCGSIVMETHKAAMVEKGRWLTTAPDVKGRAGFKINSLVSPHFNARWSVLAEEFLRAKKTPETLQTFTNLVLGEPWRLEGDELDEHDLFGRRETFGLAAIPEDVLWLTAGVDCQDDRLEVVIVGHGATDFYVLAHRVFWGPIDGDEVWRDLDSLLRETWSHPLGGRLKIDAACVDSGDGGHTEIVHGFTRPRFGRRVVAIKGVAGFSRPQLERSTSKGANALWLAGSDALKSLIFARLSRNAGIHFSDALTPVFFEQLCSERRVVRYARGTPQSRFERIKGKRAEALDALAYAIAARQLIGQSVDSRATEVRSTAPPSKRATVVQSSFLTRG